jgi:hypothetical protein
MSRLDEKTRVIAALRVHKASSESTARIMRSALTEVAENRYFTPGDDGYLYARIEGYAEDAEDAAEFAGELIEELEQAL